MLIEPRFQASKATLETLLLILLPLQYFLRHARHQPQVSQLPIGQLSRAMSLLNPGNPLCQQFLFGVLGSLLWPLSWVRLQPSAEIVGLRDEASIAPGETLADTPPHLLGHGRSARL